MNKRKRTFFYSFIALQMCCTFFPLHKLYEEQILIEKKKKKKKKTILQAGFALIFGPWPGIFGYFCGAFFFCKPGFP